MLRMSGIEGVNIEPTDGFLSDHYDPRDRTLRLSKPVYGSNSLAAIGVACHEAGHAIQHADGYVFLALRSWMVPVTMICSNLSQFVLMIGFVLMIFSGNALVLLAGCALLAVTVLFSIITLPVASARAKEQMFRLGIVTESEQKGAAKVLNAAFLTYLASAITALLTLLYYLFLIFGRRD